MVAGGRPSTADVGPYDTRPDHSSTQLASVLVSRGGRLVVIVAGSTADRLIGQLGRDDETDQELLARVTGNYRRGNERRAHRP